MPYASDRDRNPHDLELCQPAFPVPPLNLFLTSGYQPGVFDLCWDDPSVMAQNSQFVICGVNIYRSFDSEFGPYERLTDLSLGSTFYRDMTDNVVVPEETVDDSQWVHRGDCVGSDLQHPRYVFRTLRCPLVLPGSQAVPDYNTASVRVTVDGQEALIKKIVGDTGEIELETRRFPEVATQSLGEPVIPGPDSVVKVSYRYNRSLLKTDLGTRVFYRVTTIGVPIRDNLDIIRPQDLVETPLERAAFTSSREIEKLDYIWREAVRRNRWILQQGGERVKIFLRKTVGEPCPCYSFTHKQAQNDCPMCFGVGILGGYEGPYDIVVAPDDAERRINHAETGLQQEHTYEVWTGPSPIISQRDFIVKINGERYSIGAVRMPSNRGMVLQQHFNIGILNEKDIRYQVPVDGTRGMFVNESGMLVPPHLDPAQKTEKPNIPDERELRGRTKTWENITY
jgi:hypothetical protein